MNSILFLLAAITLFLVGIQSVKGSFAERARSSLIKHKVLIAGLLVLAGISSFFYYRRHVKDQESYTCIYQTTIPSTLFKVESLGKLGISLTTMPSRQSYTFYPVNKSYFEIETSAKWEYLIRKNAGSDTLYIEKDDHKLYVLISKPKAHWYDI